LLAAVFAYMTISGKLDLVQTELSGKLDLARTELSDKLDQKDILYTRDTSTAPGPKPSNAEGGRDAPLPPSQPSRPVGMPASRSVVPPFGARSLCMMRPLVKLASVILHVRSRR